MSSLVENNVMEFRTTFQPVLDQDGFLINQDGLVCREIIDLSLMVIRTSKDHKKNAITIKDIFNAELPDSLSVSLNDNGDNFLWISPDEIWLLHNRNNKDQLLEKFKSLPKGMSTTDSSGAYGILEFSGNNVDALLSRWMSYDLEGSLTIGKVVSTTCGQAPVCIYRNIEGNLLMMVRHSFSHYVAGLLKDSAKRI